MGRKQYDLEIEEALLACWLTDSEAYDKTSDIVSSDKFYSSDHIFIARAIENAKALGVDLDTFSLHAKAVIAGVENPDKIFTLGGRHVSTLSAKSYADTVRELWANRQIRRSFLDFWEDEKTGTSESLNSLVNKLSQIETNTTCDIQLAGDLNKQYLEQKIQEAESGETRKLFDCGIARIDSIVGGFEPGCLCVFSARPGVGKTALATALADGFGRQQLSTGILWYEDTKWAFSRRSIAQRVRLSSRTLRRATKSSLSDLKRAYASSQESYSWPIWLVAPRKRLDISETCATIRRLKRERFIQIVILDHLGELRLPSKGIDRHYALGEAVRQFRQTCIDCEVVPILMVQMNRDVEKEKEGEYFQKTKLSYLFGSGEIEQAARLVGFISRDIPEDYLHSSEPQTVTIDFRKNTNGRTGKITLIFHPEFMSLSSGDFPIDTKF